MKFKQDVSIKLLRQEGYLNNFEGIKIDVPNLTHLENFFIFRKQLITLQVSELNSLNNGMEEIEISKN
jgi:hypothetical protein